MLQETFSGNKKVTSGKLDLTLSITAERRAERQGPDHDQPHGPVPEPGASHAAEVRLRPQDRRRARTSRPARSRPATRATSSSRATPTRCPTRSSTPSRPGFQRSQAQQNGTKRNPSLTSLGVNPKNWLKSPKNKGERTWRARRRSTSRRASTSPSCSTASASCWARRASSASSADAAAPEHADRGAEEAGPGRDPGPDLRRLHRQGRQDRAPAHGQAQVQGAEASQQRANGRRAARSPSTSRSASSTSRRRSTRPPTPSRSPTSPARSAASERSGRSAAAAAGGTGSTGGTAPPAQRAKVQATRCGSRRGDIAGLRQAAHAAQVAAGRRTLGRRRAAPPAACERSVSTTAPSPPGLGRFLCSGQGWPYLLMPFIPIAVSLEVAGADAGARVLRVRGRRGPDRGADGPRDRGAGRPLGPGHRRAAQRHLRQRARADHRAVRARRRGCTRSSRPR